MNEKINEQDPLPIAGCNVADGTLEEGRRFFSTLAQISPVGIFRTDAQGNCVYVNECWCKITGRLSADALGRGWAQAVHPDDRERVAQAWYTSAQARQNFVMEYRILRQNGATRWVLGQAAAERGAAGEMAGYVGTITDITQSKQAEEEFQKFFNLIPDLACIASADGRFLRINRMWQETLGFSEQKILATPFLDLIHPDDRDATMKEVERQLAGEATIQFTNRYRCKDGSYRWLEWRATPAVDRKLLFASARDITERKRLEVIKQEVLDRLQKISSQVPGIVYQFRLRPDGSTCVPYASEAARQIYRLDPEEIREDATKVFTPVHPDDLENFKASIQVSAQDLLPWQHEYRLKFDDGTVRWLFGNAIPQREADGSTLWHGFLTDITEHKNSEERLKRSEEKLQAYLDNISDTIWLIGADLNMAYVSSSVTQLLGVLPEELIGRPSALVIHPDDMDVVTNAQRYVVEHPGEPHTIQYRVSHKDGRWIHVESSGVNMLGNPAINGVLVTMRDITGHKNIEDELKQTKERYDFATAIGKVGTWDWNPATGDLIWSNETFRLLGLTPGTVTPSYELFLGKVHPDDREFLDSAVQAALHDKKSYAIDCRIVSGSGDELTCHITGEVEFDAKDHPIRMLGTIHDITERKQSEQALTESESRFREIFNTVSDAIFIHDAETGRIIDVNRRMCEMYGLTHEQALACGVNDLSAGTPPYSTAEALEKIHLAHTDGPQTFDWLARARDGHLFWVEVSLKFALIGNHQRILAVVRDISERKQAEEELRIAATVFESQEGMIVTDAHSVILRVNHAFTGITGYTAEEAVGQTPRLLSSGRHDAVFYAAMWKCIRYAGVWQGEIWNRRKNGEVYPEHLTITAVKGSAGEVTHYVATLHDITERKMAEEEINNLAFYDTLTQLPNRRMLNDRIGQAIAASKRSGHYGALMFLDLDNFKPLNDTYGHGVGDLLLIEVAHRLTNCVREVDTVARFGGDEFVVMLNELGEDKTESATQAGIVAEKIRIALAEQYFLNYRHEGEAERTVEHHCAASIGVVVFNSEADAEDLIKWADIAMYQAKEGGRNSVHFFDPEPGSLPLF
ncbi:MAG: PAS domain S-box protein [Gallionella sp.]|nr:PAS domain S-box protein [Gallionella sp.]